MSEFEASIGHLVKRLLRSGVFDEAHYLGQLPPLQRVGVNPVEHYLLTGSQTGLTPNRYFDPAWYSKTYGVDPQKAFLHYLAEGETAGNKPSVHFEPHWFAERYGLTPDQSPLGVYTTRRPGDAYSPNALFDVEYYLEAYPDIASAAVDPYHHFVSWGVFEGRRPSPFFDQHHVWAQYLNNDRSKNPFTTFLEYKDLFGWTAVVPPEVPTISREVRRFTAPGPDFERKPPRVTGTARAKVLAFYLPQYHAIAENDFWWGAGFTEWRNLSRGQPRFVGHYQPRIPRDLGFYDLTGTDVMARQVDLAVQAGLFGFVFYYYNFNGRRLLERPLDAYVADPAITFPFCLMWANENWTRRWDGMERDVLISQDYDPAGAPALIDDVARYMKHPGYVRIEDRPVLFLYRADVVPDCAKTLQRWRALFRERHGLDPLIIMAQTFGNTDPRVYGFDAALEFPPHKFGSLVPTINHSVQVLDPDYRGEVRSYDDVVAASTADFPADFPLIKTVFPSWDNDARRQGAGMVVQGTTPQKFGAWIESVVDHLEQEPVLGERLLCVNAWNEWCEGAYLEPDVHYGHAYLSALARAVSGQKPAARRKILLVGHDAFHAGAQHLLLNIGSLLAFRFGFEVSFVLMGGGKLVDSYAEVGHTHVVEPGTNFWPALTAHLRNLFETGTRCAITNSTFSGHVVSVLEDLGFQTTALVHELTNMIVRNGGTGHIKNILGHAHTVVFPSAYVQDEIVSTFGPVRGTSLLRPQGSYKDITRIEGAAGRVRASLSLPPDAKIILNMGYADLRKGVDIFVSIARLAMQSAPKLWFVWLGDADPTVDSWLLESVRADPTSNIRFVPFTENVGEYLSAADLFLLTSREDPFPTVVLEALSIGLPVAAFDTGGGFVELLRDPKLGLLLPSGNMSSATASILTAVTAGRLMTPALMAYRQGVIASRFNFLDYCVDLCRTFGPIQTVSVVVPNYNYAAYLKARLGSIFDQSYPIFEVIVLDDCSSDDSLAEIEKLNGVFGRDLTLVENEANSGNVFAQWAKGVSLCRGDLVWIAEADDLSDPSFVETLAAHFEDKKTLLAFSNSRTIDQNGQPQWESYKGYYDTLFPGALSVSEVFDAQRFLSEFLAVKNVILNASSVLWRRSVLETVLTRCATDLAHYRMAGDWRLYVEACRLEGTIAYEAAPLNVHRRHEASVTHALRKEQHLDEIRQIHAEIRDTGLGPAQANEQTEYVRQVARDFGLPEPVG